MRREQAGQRMYVVYLQSVGNTPIGIYHRRVSFDARLAFIHPQNDGARADILPRGNVFATKREAEVYLAGKGVERWVVDPGSFREARPASIFRALVRYYTDEVYSGRRFGGNKAIVRLDGKELPSRAYHFEIFETKKEARVYFCTCRDEQKKTARENKAAAEAMLKALAAETRGSR